METGSTYLGTGASLDRAGSGKDSDTEATSVRPTDLVSYRVNPTHTARIPCVPSDPPIWGISALCWKLGQNKVGEERIIKSLHV